MKYVFLSNNIAMFIVDEFDPMFPDIPIEDRYSADFLSHCIAYDGEVEQNWIWDGESFNPPPVPEEPEEEETDKEETEEE